MKQVKQMLTAIALFVAIGIPQCTMAQLTWKWSDFQQNSEKKEMPKLQVYRNLSYEEQVIFLRMMLTRMKDVNLDTLWLCNYLDITREEFDKRLADIYKGDQPNASQQTFNPVGKWINKNATDQKFEYKSDHTFTFQKVGNSSYTVKGTDIVFPSVCRTWRGTWNVEGNVLTSNYNQHEIAIGDISYYPADDQQRIKDYVRDLEINDEKETYHEIIKSISPISMVLTSVDGEHEYEFNRDVKNMTAQEKAEYDKEVERLNQEKKEEELRAKKAAQARDDRVMARLKAKAIASGNQYDYWIIGYTYENGEGNDNVKVTINLDSALVWYKKAAAIDPKNETYVTALKHKMKTGGNYYEDKAKETIANAKKKAASLGSKYGAAYVNSLLNTGNIKVGTPVALLQEYVSIINSLREMERSSTFKINYFEPTTRDMMQYGRAAKRVKIVDDVFTCYSLMVVNGKVVAVYSQIPTALKFK